MGSCSAFCLRVPRSWAGGIFRMPQKVPHREGLGIQDENHPTSVEPTKKAATNINAW